MASSADLLALLLVLAAAVATLNERFVLLPRAIALLLASLGVAGLIAAIDAYVAVDLSGWMRGMLGSAALPRVLLDVVLGLLLFAASLHVDLTELRRQKWTILVLATASAIIATTVFAVGIWVLFRLAGSPIPLAWCAVLGAVLAPTDAVVIESLLHRARLPAGLKAAISGESLFNDGAGVVLFQVMLRLAEGEHGLIGRGQVVLGLLVEGVGGGILGCLTGWLAARLMRWADEAGLRLMVSLALAIGTYRLADAASVSGPTAVVACGLVLRLAPPPEATGTSAIGQIGGFWTVIDDLLNAMLFVLIGLEVFAVNFARVVSLAAIGALPLSLLARYLGVAAPMRLLQGRGGPQRRAVGVLTWAGLRGGVSIALALTLPPSPYRGRLIVICYAVVIFSMLVQGLTMPLVIRRLFGRSDAAE